MAARGRPRAINSRRCQRPTAPRCSPSSTRYDARAGAWSPTHHQVNFLLTSGEGWLATTDSSGALERQASSFQWDNHAILVRRNRIFSRLTPVSNSNYDLIYRSNVGINSVIPWIDSN